MQAVDGQSSITDVQTVITLVHGTFAKNAPWIQPDSALSKALTKRFGDQTLVLPFNWSGGNTNSARREASKALRTHLSEQLDANRAARHYLICHSHGGNVALHALSDSMLEERITGVVCLSTPFIVAHERDFGPDPSKHLTGVSLILYFFFNIIILRYMLINYTIDWKNSNWLDVLKILIPCIIAGNFTLYIARFITNSIHNKWSKYVQKLKLDLTSPVIDRSKVLIIRSPADEASGLLIFFQFLTQITVRVYLIIFSSAEWIKNIIDQYTTNRWKSFIVFICSSFPYLTFVYLTIWTWMRFTSFISIFITAVPAFIFYNICAHSFVTFLVKRNISSYNKLLIALSALTWPVILLTSIMLVVPFGWEIALANILLNITAETTPIGSWTVHLVNPPTSKVLGQNTPPLMHSVSYDDTQVFKLITDWIETRPVQDQIVVP